LLLYQKDSLNVSDAGIVYDKSAEIVFSSVGPILSLMIEIPKPKLLLFRGVFIDAVFVTGARQVQPTAFYAMQNTHYSS
jgi:hypothetical protein